MAPLRKRRLDAEEILAFDHLNDELLERVRVIRTNLLPPAADGMTVGNRIFLRGDRIEHRASSLLAHELVHVRQFAEMGPSRFLTQYFGAYLRNLVKYRNHHQAYLEIPFEIEARREAALWAQKTGSTIPKH